MPVTSDTRDPIREKVPKIPYRFNMMEFSGSLGDLGLFIPLVVAMTVTCGLDIGVILIFAGLMNVATGILFRQPIAVQPMKTIAAVAITEQLGAGEIVAAGLLMGIAMIGVAGIITKIDRFIPRSVVRGIQLGVGLKLAAQGAKWISQLSFWGWDSLVVASLILGMLLLLMTKKKPALLIVFLFGILILFCKNPASFGVLNFSLPVIKFHWPVVSEWKTGLWRGVLPQFPLTLLNSVIAVCALSADYFPGKGVSTKKISLSVGLMNLFCVPWGAIPMCHGAGGFAAQYRFGARSGGCGIMVGALKIFVGVIFGSSLVILLKEYPMSILGLLLVFAGIELAKSAKDVVSCSRDFLVALVTAAFIIGINTGVGFLAGLGLSGILRIHEGCRGES